MTTAGLDINQGTEGDALVLCVEGNIDLSNVNYFIERLYEASANGDRKIILDLTDVEFIDSTVINALYGAAPRIRQYGGDLAIVIADSPAARVLDLAGVDVMYRVAKTQKKALERLNLTTGRTA
jgi:anti-sigma B factor antagonist